MAKYSYILGKSGERVKLEESDSDGPKRTVEYEYDQLYRLIKETISKTTDGKVVNYLVDTSGMLSYVLAEYDHEDNLIVYYTRGDDLISQERQGQKHYYLYDGHNSVRILVDEEGNITDTYTYDAFGNLIDRTGTTENDYLYCGEQFNGTTGLYYLRARYMNPSTGTFISMDKYQGTINDPISLHKYLYANSNPVMYNDPTGYQTATLEETMEVVAILGILATTIVMFTKCLGPVFETISFLTTEINLDYTSPVITYIEDTVWYLFNGGITVGDTAEDIREDVIYKAEEKSNNKDKTKNLGDAKVKDLKRIPKNKIKELGGEDYTQPTKRDGGKSRSDLYWNPKTGDVYSVPKGGGIPQWVDNIPIN